MSRPSAALVLVLAVAAWPSFGAEGRRAAITFDDLPGIHTPARDGCDPDALDQLNRDMTGSIRRNRVPAIGFVNTARCEISSGTMQSALEHWIRAGLTLGNHTASHHDLNSTPLDEYERDTAAADAFLTRLQPSKSGPRYFRYPYLHTGMDLKKKRDFEAFLRERGYTIVPVTIDNDDYIYARSYVDALRRRNMPLARRIADDYVRYMEQMFDFYERLSRETLGYEVPQILLLHDSRLNADQFDRLAAMIRRRGYRFVTVDEALQDPAYHKADGWTGERGVSWLLRWAADAHKPTPEQPVPPEWVSSMVTGTDGR